MRACNIIYWIESVWVLAKMILTTSYMGLWGFHLSWHRYLSILIKLQISFVCFVEVSTMFTYGRRGTGRFEGNQR